MKSSLYSLYIKRVVDLLMALGCLIVLAPVLASVTILLYFANRGKPFFIQSRPGKNNKPFNIIKFKSMTDEKDLRGFLLPDRERMTKVGSFIRKTSLDELPQLFNVLLGHMSFVGPRPLLFKYIPLYNENQKRRSLVRPGITGWAQVNGRNSISWNARFRYDIYYVDNLSFFLDIKILWMTILKVIKKEGVNQSDERPMSPFEGNN